MRHPLLCDLAAQMPITAGSPGIWKKFSYNRDNASLDWLRALHPVADIGVFLVLASRGHVQDSIIEVRER